MVERKKFPISVLIVDDESSIVEQLALILGRRVEVFYTASNGAEGYECYEREHPDLIISDIDMPTMNGIEFLKLVRAHDRHIPFILSTGLKSLDILIEAIEQGITAFLPKPLQIQTLIAKLEEVANIKELALEAKSSTLLLDQYKKIVDDSVIVSKADTKGIITYVNDMFCSVSGYNRDELIGQPHSIVRDPSMASSTFKEVWETIQAKKIWHGIIHNRAKDGSRYTVKSTIAPLFDNEGNIIEYIALREDVTELQRAKEEAKQSAKIKGDFLATMSHEIRTPMNGILGFTDLLSRSSLDEQQKRYLDIINGSTHSLLGIINDILDFSKLESGKLELDLTPVNPIVEFDKIAQLFSAKMEEKHIVFDVEIDAQVSECIFIDLLRIQQVISNLLNNATKFTAENGNIKFYTKFIQSEKEGIRIRIGVKDSGIGITLDQQKKIFEEFSQADSSTTRQFGGTGLGLSISSHLVSLMESELKVESEIGKGSNFFFELSVKRCMADHALSSIFTMQNISLIYTEEHLICQTHVLTYLDKLHIPYKIHQISEDISSLNPEDIVIIFCNTDLEMMNWLIQKKVTTIMFCSDTKVAVSASNVTVVHDLEHNTSSLYNALLRTAKEIEFKKIKNLPEERILFSGKVLVAEDNQVNQLLIEEYLQRYNIAVEIVENGKEALARMEHTVYDLILMDVNMPIMSGIEAVVLVKEKKILTPIVALTANAMAGDREKFLEYGFDNYLSKPIVFKQLEEILESYLIHAHARERLTNENGPFVTKILSQPIVDLKLLQQELDLPENVIHKLLFAFLKTSDNNLLELKIAIDENNFTKIEGSAHKIKGAAGNMRFYPIEELCGEIEILARSKENVDYKKLYLDFEKKMKEVQEEIRKMSLE